ncbi:hypothetical protein ACQPZ2_34040 [Nocardia pseudovaccinii]|uniref:hypothetical protein n=1 Tax=Nocardia pseudovaccinii TaxID=189540 RepID=UPI003D937472
MAAGDRPAGESRNPPRRRRERIRRRGRSGYLSAAQALDCAVHVLDEEVEQVGQ